MAQQDEAIIPQGLGERAREQVEAIAGRGRTVLTMGEEEVHALVNGIEESVVAALEARPGEHNVAPAFALGSLFGAAVAIIAVVVGAALGGS